MNFLQKKSIVVLSIIIGLVGGYLYYSEIGCITGNCPITSNPWLSSFYGGAIGYFVGGIFKKPSKV